MTYQTYQEYIQSPAWQRKARAVKEQAGVCAVCTRTTGLEVHHRTYVRLGREHPSDLVVLCERHHRLIHGTFDDCMERQLMLPLLPRGPELN